MKCLAHSTEKVREDAIKDAGFVFMVSVATVLTDKLHFGAPKAKMALKQILNCFDAINADYISVADLQAVLKDEYDIDIKR